MTEKTVEEFLMQREWLPNAGWTKADIIKAMESYALYKSKEAFEAGRTFVDAEDSELRKANKLFDKLKYKDADHYLNSVK